MAERRLPARTRLGSPGGAPLPEELGPETWSRGFARPSEPRVPSRWLAPALVTLAMALLVLLVLLGYRYVRAQSDFDPGVDEPGDATPTSPLELDTGEGA